MSRFLSGLVGFAMLLVGCSADEGPVAAPLEAEIPAAEPAEPAPDPEPEPEPEPEPRTEPTPEGPPVAAEDPAGLAAQLTEVERAIRDAGRDVDDLDRDGHLQQLAYRRLARNPEWMDEVLAAVPGELRDAVRANTAASVELLAMTTPQPGGQRPQWRIVEPAPAGALTGYYREAQEMFGVGWEYLAAIHLVETRMGKIRGTSVAGAQGPMQFMPGTWDAYGEGDVNDNRDAIIAAARYLHASGGPGDMDRALFAYNRSDRYVRALGHYASVMRADPLAYRGYYHWEVYYLTEEGDVWLPVGFGAQ